MNTRRITAIAASLLLGGSLAFMAVSTVAATGPTTGGPSGKGVCRPQAQASASASRAPLSVEALRAFGDCEINRRLATLTDLSAKIAASKVITSSHAAALQSEIGSTRSGLTSLKATIDAETDLTALKADITKIATDYRVYVLVVPQVHMVTASDGVLAAQARFAEINTKLTAAIAAAKAAGKNTTAAQTALDAMNASVAAAVGLATPLPASLLALTPAQYNGGTAGPVLAAARKALGTARTDLKAAVASAKACRDALK